MIETDSIDQKVLRQLEYYFGDINLPRDKFLQEEMKKDNGWVELAIMLKFNRLAQLTTDTDKIVAALEPSELIEVSDDKKKIRRSPEVPLPDNTLEYWQEIKRRTVYVKGFEPETTLDEIQAFLVPHGDIKNIVMRRFKKERTFKGSIFATFVDRESAEKFAKDESTMTYKDKPLVKMLQDEYWAAKSKETKEKRQAEKQAKLSKKVNHDVNGKGRGNKGRGNKGGGYKGKGPAKMSKHIVFKSEDDENDAAKGGDVATNEVKSEDVAAKEVKSEGTVTAAKEVESEGAVTVAKEVESEDNSKKRLHEQGDNEPDSKKVKSEDADSGKKRLHEQVDDEPDSKKPKNVEAAKEES